MSRYQRFRNWNYRLSLGCYGGLFPGGEKDEDAIIGFSKHPYAWLWLLVPISGLVGLAAVVHEENMVRRHMELEEQKSKLQKRLEDLAMDSWAKVTKSKLDYLERANERVRRG